MQDDTEALRALRQMKYPHLSEEHWTYFVKICELRNLSILGQQAYPELQHDERSGLPVVQVIVGINGLRSIATRTGLYAGSDAPKFTYAHDDRIPTQATVTVHKFVCGQRCGFIGFALWDEYYPKDIMGLVEQMPCDSLARCAEAVALRKAFPEETAGLYTSDEMLQARSRTRGGSGTATSAQASGEAFVPDNPMGFHRALMDLGLDRMEQRNDLIEQFRAKHPRMMEDNTELFYGMVLQELRTNPTAYGLAV